jgi:hypothetical protein
MHVGLVMLGSHTYIHTNTYIQTHTYIYKTEPLVPEMSAFEFKMAMQKLKANLHMPRRANAVPMPYSCRAHAVLMPCPCRTHAVPMPFPCHALPR